MIKTVLYYKIIEENPHPKNRHCEVTGVTGCGVSKSLAEFAARRRQKIGIIFHRDMRVGKNTAQTASVEFCRKAAKLCAQQAANPLAEKTKFFRQVI